MASSLRAISQNAAYRAECNTLNTGPAKALPEETEARWTAHAR